MQGGVAGVGGPRHAVAAAFEFAAEFVALLDDDGRGHGAAGRVFREEVADEVVEFVRQLGQEVRGPVRQGVTVLVQELGRGDGGERRPAGEGRVKHAAQGVEVALLRGGLARKQFRGEERDRPPRLGR